MAMKMITLWGAEQFGEQATQGSIKEGKIEVLETSKEGKTVWSRR